MRRGTLWAAPLAVGAVAWLAGAAFDATPLRWLGAAVGLGFAPGFAVSRLLGGVERGWLVISRSLFIGPLVSGAAATVLLVLGLTVPTAALLCLAAGYGAAFLALLRGQSPAGPSPRWERRLIVWLVVLAALALLPHALRSWVRMRSDAVFHTAVVFEIASRGVPPGDPYFAGLSLSYIWFYHAMLAVWAEAAGVLAWDLGGLLNAFWLVSLGGAVYALSRRAGRPGREAFFAALFVPLGLNAFFFLGFGVKLARSLVGETAGWGELRRLFSLRPFTFDQMLAFTSIYGSPPAFLNKYLVMTGLGGAITSLAWLGEGLVGWARSSSRPPRASGETARRFAGVSLAAFGAWVWNPGVAGAGALGLLPAGALLLAWPGAVRRRVVVMGASAFACGSALAAPLLLQTVGRAEASLPIGWSPAWAGILIASAAALVLGLPALRRLPARAGARAFRALALGMMVAALWTVLPPPNSGDKMPFVFYLFLAVAAGWTLARWWTALRARGRSAWAWTILIALCVPISALYLAVYLFEKAPAPSSRDARSLYAWMAERTPPDAVFVDSQERADVLALVPRRQYWGREPYAHQRGYPSAEMNRRRDVRDALVGVCVDSRYPRPAIAPVDTTATLDALDAFAAENVGPLYVLWRTSDHGSARAGTSFMGRRADRFEIVWWNPEATVFRFLPARRAQGEP